MWYMIPKTAVHSKYITASTTCKTGRRECKRLFCMDFLDNFEWAEGYHPRFGLVHVDFQTQHRIVKSSGHWYADFIK